MPVAVDEKPIVWVRSSKEDLKAFPKEVRSQIGYALAVAQEGGKHPDSKPLKGFAGVSLLEVVEDFDGDTYRAVYTVRFEEAMCCMPSRKSQNPELRPRNGRSR